MLKDRKKTGKAVSLKTPAEVSRAPRHALNPDSATDRDTRSPGEFSIADAMKKAMAPDQIAALAAGYSTQIGEALKTASLGFDLSELTMPIPLSKAIEALEPAFTQADHRKLHGEAYRDLYGSPAREVLDRIGSAGPPQRPQPALPSPAKVSSAKGTQSQPERSTSAMPAGTTIAGVADIGKRVRDARKVMGMTQQRFADLAGVGRRFLIELEQGKPSLEIGRVLAVCQAAGVRIGFLP